jgi:hypothetical protein
MDLTVKIEGLDELRERFGQANEIVDRELRRAMTRAVIGELGRMPPYPPGPPRSGYLGRSLTALIGRMPDAASEVRIGRGGIEGVIGTNVVYAGRVIGQNQGKPWKRNGWWRLEEVVLSHKADIEAEFEDAAARIAEQLDGAAGA